MLERQRLDPLKALEAKKAKLLADAQAAAAEIERDLAELQRAKRLAEKYGLELVERGAVEAPKPVAPAAHPFDERSARYNPSAKRQRLMGDESPRRIAQKEAERLIRLANEPVALGSIRGALDGMGVHIGGERPNATLSAYLSDSDTLKSVRKGFWGLKEWDQEDMGIKKTGAVNATTDAATSVEIKSAPNSPDMSWIEE